MAQLRLRRDRLARFRKDAGITTDKDLAARIDMDPGQVSRILGGAAFGPRFIAGVLDVFGIAFFEDLFEVCPDDDGGDAA